ncbi:c-type cytochrome [Hyphomicrobium sp.]|uniref:c-type cytochrome n=1 Tax=Hyphomicrobium sp. TaxID=82 RepID=UPI002BDB9BF7|nr:c-type cytochrome [Hyphomicrobium sp.]HRN88802.1 c-type cytochrome [Hyphomicrobium sp.]HRQ25473.1 c-type cytochrome [Hyphomicrobium sp.]
MRTAFLALILSASCLSVGAANPAAAGAGPAPGGDASKGQIEFNNHCRTCHTVNEGDNRLGPSLHNIFGSPAGQVEGFGNYSGGLTSSITWDEATLDKFIANPQSVASNTTMTPFAGVEDAETRKQIIQYLKEQKEGS